MENIARNIAPDGRVFPWGEITKIHAVGAYKFVEYIRRRDKEPDSIEFSIFINDHSIGRGGYTIEQAMATAMAYRFDGANSQADVMFMRMIGDKENDECMRNKQPTEQTKAA